MFAELLQKAGNYGAERAGHKYKSRRPDGHGGWEYEYADDHPSHQQSFLLDDVRKPAAPKGKPVEDKPKQQLSLFADLVAAKPAPTAAAMRATTATPALHAAAKAKVEDKSAFDLFSYAEIVKAPPQTPVLVDATPPAVPELKPAAAPATIDLTKGQRKTANETALEIVADVVKTGRQMTDDERAQVSLYSGEGGIGASLNQFFTRGDVAQAVWGLLTKLGIQKGAKVLEPACGAGVFIDTAPDGVDMTGVEIDPAVAAVADALHGQKHHIFATSFEEFAIAREGLADAQFDAVITNAPFCQRTGGGIRIHKPEMASADRYFIDTALDSVKDGGLVAMIVHHGVMTGADGADFRQELQGRAELMDAYRLPTSAFEHANTQVIADVIVLRKRDSRISATLQSASEKVQRAAGVYDDKFVSGDWFDAHPERVLGKATEITNRWGKNEITVTADAKTIAPAIAAATPIDTGPAGHKVDFATLQAHADAGDAEMAAALKKGVKIASVQPSRGATKCVAGITYLLTGDPPRWHRLDAIDDVAAIVRNSSAPVIKQAALIAEGIGDLLKALEAGDFYKSRFMRRKLAENVQDWIAENGLPAEHKELVAMAKIDPGMLRLVGAVQPDGTLSDVLSRDPAAVVPAAVVNAADLQALCAWMAAHNNGYVTVSDVEKNWTGAAGKSQAELRKAILDTGNYAIESNGELRHIEDYLTGNLYTKRDAAQVQLAGADAADKGYIEAQIAALTKQLDSRAKTLDDVLVTPGAGWIPKSVLSAFLSTIDGYQAAFGQSRNWRDADVKVEITYDNAMYRMERTYTDGRHTIDDGGGEPLLRALNRMRLSKDERADMEHFDDLYAEWVKSSEFRPMLEDTYNRLFFSDAKREFSGADLALPGLSATVKANPYVNETVRWATDAQQGIIALDVGLGKTFTGILLARQLKSQGIVKKPVCIVPKSVATNWAEEIETITPGARVLVIGETRGKRKDGSIRVDADDDKERNRKLALMQQNDYDLVLITKPAFERIPLKQETIEKYENSDFWTQRANQIDAIAEKKNKSKGKDSSASQQKRMAKLKAAHEAQQAATDFHHEKSSIFWEDLNVDCLMADEAHAYKNLNAAHNRRGSAPPKFLGGSAESKQAKHMKFMAKAVRENTKGRVYFLTATPTKNSPLEVYNMLEHLVPEEWEKRGIRNAEEFIDRYCDLRKQQILNKDGEIEEADVVAGFRHLDELTDLMDRYMRVRTADDVGLPIPSIHEELELVSMTAAQRGVYAELRAEAAEPASKDDPGKVFRLLDKMKKAAQDLELYDPDLYKGDFRDSPKYQACVKNVATAVLNGKKAAAAAAAQGLPYNGHGQLVFVDNNACHERVKTMLVEAGLEPDEIEIINASETEDSEARQDVGRRFNSGKVSVVIGNTATMGEGVNLQKKTTDIHHLDQPWDPGSMRQRNGRGVRQGNPNPIVKIHTYLAKASFDGFRHGTLQGKKGWLDKLRSGAEHIENEAAAEGMAKGDDLLVMLSDDPDGTAARLKEERQNKLGEWAEKKKAEAIHEFGKVLLLRERAKTMREKGASDEDVAKLHDTIAKATQRLERDEALPESVKQMMHLPNVRGLADPATGKVFLVGYSLIPEGGQNNYGGKWLVKDVDVKNQKLIARQWGSGRVQEVPLDQAGKLYLNGSETVDDEVKGQIEKTAKNTERYNDLYYQLEGLDPEAVDAHAGEVQRALRESIKAGAGNYSSRQILAHDGDSFVAKERREITPETRIYIPGTRDNDALTAKVADELARTGKDKEKIHNISADASYTAKMIESTLGYGPARQILQAALEKLQKQAKRQARAEALLPAAAGAVS